MSTIIAAYGGGFKPPTSGHFEVVKSALEKYPEIDEFIIYVGSGERDGISQEESILIWNTYLNYLPMKVRIEPSKGPIGDIIRLGKNNPEDEIYFVIGGRDGNEGDMKDIASRTKTIEVAYPNMKVKVITTPDRGISGTNARKAAKESEEVLSKYLPNILTSEEKSEIFNILRPVIKENIEDDVMSLNEKITKFLNEENIKLPVNKEIVLQADTEEHTRGLIVKWRSDGGYDVAYWDGEPNNIVPAELVGDGESFGDIKNVWLGYHPTLDDKKKINENATYSQTIDIKEKIASLTDHMIKKGYNIEPLPTVEFIDGDSENASNFLGKTAYYDPDSKTIALYTEGRHPKDITRSYAHELIHHIQNLEGRLGDIKTTNTLEDDALNDLEAEANLKGTMTFRNWTDSLNEDKDYFGLNKFIEEVFLNEGKYDSLVTKLAGYTLNAWKDDLKDGQSEGKFKLEVGPGKEFDYPHLDFQYSAVAKFDGTYQDKSSAYPLSSKVLIRYFLDADELPKMWSRIAMDLRNTIRHEIEHLMQSGPNAKKGKEIEKDYSERDEIKTGNKKWWKVWRSKLESVDYYKLAKEIDANLQGLYLKAKKSRTPLKDVIDTYVRYDLNLSIDDQKAVKDIWRERAPKLNIPLFEDEQPEYKIFSDMDGVLTDFEAAFENVSDGILPREYERRFGKEKFWELIDGEGVDYWTEMPYMSDGRQYWDYIKNYNPELLSSPSRSSTSRLGQRQWVENNMPGVKLTLAQAYLKRNYAAPNHILIDDRKSNIEEWRANGGIGILHTSAADTISQLKELGL